MSRLIEELRAEHAEIVDTLLRVKLLNVVSSDGHQKLMTFKERIFEHLKKEEAQLFPLLKLAANDDPELKQRLDDSEDHIAEVSKNVFHFYEKYSGYNIKKIEVPKRKFSLFAKEPPAVNRENHDEFLQDFEKVYHGLLARLDKEEKVLFKAFERLDQQAPASDPASGR